MTTHNEAQASDESWLSELLEVAEEAYDAATKVSGSALLAGETPKSKRAEQQRLVYDQACVVMSSLFCVVDELRNRISDSPALAVQASEAPRELRDEDFEAHFQAMELGDGDVPLPTPTDGARWDAYVIRHQLALGIWRFAQERLTSLPAPASPAAQPAEQLLPVPGTVDEMLEWIVSMTDDTPIRNMARAARERIAQDATQPASAPSQPVAAQPVDPTDPGYDVVVLREHIRHLERRVQQLSSPAAQAQEVMTGRLIRALESAADTLEDFGHNSPEAFTQAQSIREVLRADSAPTDDGRKA